MDVFKIMKISLFSAILFCLTLPLHAQPDNQWVRYYDGHRGYDVFYDVFHTAQGGYAMAGWTTLENRQSGYWLVLTDVDGREIWQQTYTDDRFPDSNNWCYTLIQDDDNGFVLGGRVCDDADISHFSMLRTDRNGNQLWWRTYGEPGRYAECYAVIELKAGDFLGAGRNGDFEAYAVRVDGNGNVVWEETYPGRWFRAIRETQGGVLLAGQDNGGNAWLLKTNFQGEMLWERSYDEGQFMSLVSCLAGGFAASGQNTAGEDGDWYLVRVNDAGQEMWSRQFDFGDNDWSTCLTRIWDDGLALVGRVGPGYDAPAILRTDAPGNEMWRRLDRNRFGERGRDEYNSIICGEDNFLLAAGTVMGVEENAVDGVLVKILPDRSAPVILDYSPDSLYIQTLVGDSIDFAIIEADDAQGDSLSYLWVVNEDTVGTETSQEVIFEQQGEYSIICNVSDDDLSTSIEWSVDVHEFLLRGFEPDSLHLIVRRGSEQDFSLDIAAIDEVEPAFEWIFTHRNQQREEVGGEPSLSLNFPFAGNHRLEATVLHEDHTEEVTWEINVRSTIWSWLPEELRFETYEDSIVEFNVLPFNPNSDSLEFQWMIDDDEYAVDTNAIDFNFPELGEHRIIAYVQDGAERDTVTWSIEVQERSFTADGTDGADFPTTPVLSPAYPNPFNAMTTLMFYLPNAERIKLSVFDIFGREVERLVDKQVRSGWQSVTWDAGDLPAGVYLVMMKDEGGGMNLMRKVVLVR